MIHTEKTMIQIDGSVLGFFFPMVFCEYRNEFYESFFRDNIKGKILLDVGAGTGLLSILALKHGAKKCIMVEQDEKCYHFLKNNFDDKRIEIYHDKLDAALTDKFNADIVICELFGCEYFGENCEYVLSGLQTFFFPALVEFELIIHEIKPEMINYTKSTFDNRGEYPNLVRKTPIGNVLYRIKSGQYKTTGLDLYENQIDFKIEGKFSNVFVEINYILSHEKYTLDKKMSNGWRQAIWFFEEINCETLKFKNSRILNYNYNFENYNTKLRLL